MTRSHVDSVALRMLIERHWEMLRRADLAAYERHSRMQAALSDLARAYGCIGWQEYPVFYDTGQDVRSGRLDVLWLRVGRPWLAIELDSSLRRKSVSKLLAIEAPYRYWLYFGSRSADDVDDWLRRQDTYQQVVLVRLGRL